MIKLRPRPKAPASLSSEKVTTQLKKLYEKVVLQQKKTTGDDFPSLWGNSATSFFFHSGIAEELNEALSETVNFNTLLNKSYLSWSELKNELKQLKKWIQEDLEYIQAMFEENCITVPTLLHRHQHGKCCYCERSDLPPKREPDLEHFRPKSEVTEDPSHPGYWWLAYEWENYLISCKWCNQEIKKTQFPLKNPSARIQTPNNYKMPDEYLAELEQEQPLLLDPYDQKTDPEDHIDYEWDDSQIDSFHNLVKAKGKTVEGRATVDKLTGLNASNVMEGRGKLITYLDASALILKKALNEDDQKAKANYTRKVKKATHPSAAYAGFARYFFKQRGLGDYIYTDMIQ